MEQHPEHSSATWSSWNHRPLSFIRCLVPLLVPLLVPILVYPSIQVVVCVSTLPLWLGEASEAAPFFLNFNSASTLAILFSPLWLLWHVRVGALVLAPQPARRLRLLVHVCVTAFISWGSELEQNPPRASVLVSTVERSSTFSVVDWQLIHWRAFLQVYGFNS